MTRIATMGAMATTREGDLDRIVQAPDRSRSGPAPGEVRVRVCACGFSNTDLNTRTGWYSMAASKTTMGNADAKVADDIPACGGAPAAVTRILGADFRGRVEVVGREVTPAGRGKRDLSCDARRDPDDPHDKGKTGHFGSERDGGFGECCTIPARNALAIGNSPSDPELATFSCFDPTGDGMLIRTGMTEADTVLVPGASGVAGGQWVQGAERRGARVIALASEAKHTEVAAPGPGRRRPRVPDDLRTAHDYESGIVVADVRGGPVWPVLIDLGAGKSRNAPFEQPCDSFGDVAAIAGNHLAPVAVAESLGTRQDAARIARDGMAEVVGAKPNRVSGLTRAERMRDIARAHGIDLFVTAAGRGLRADREARHLAATVPDHACRAVWTFQDRITKDIAAGQDPPRIDGQLSPSEVPGLGDHPDPAAPGPSVTISKVAT